MDRRYLRALPLWMLVVEQVLRPRKHQMDHQKEVLRWERERPLQALVRQMDH